MDDPTFQVLPLDDPPGLRLVGELDMATVPELQTAFDLLPPGKVTLDFTELSFIDSSGLNAIVKYAVSLNGASPIVLVHVPDPIRRVFEITQLNGHPAIELRSDDDGS
jgi:anti-anti-sigma factor